MSPGNDDARRPAGGDAQVSNTTSVPRSHVRCSACGTLADWRMLPGGKHLEHFARGIYPYSTPDQRAAGIAGLTELDCELLRFGDTPTICPGRPLLAERVAQISLGADGQLEVTE